MHTSGIIVTLLPERMEICRRDIESLPGVEVRLTYPEQGKMVVVQETGDGEAQEDLLRRIQAHPDVLAADLVYHHVEHETQRGESP